VPLALFVAMTITVAVFALVAALLIALVGTLAFILLAVVAALVFLLPTLFFTTLVATFVFLWGLGAYYIVKWFNEKEVPGIHVGLVEGLKKDSMEMTEPDDQHQKETEALGEQRQPPEKSQQTSSAGQDKSQADSTQRSQPGSDKGQAQNGSARPKKLATPSQQQPQQQSQQQSRQQPQQGGGLDAVGKATGVEGATGGGLTKGVQGARQAVPGGVV